MGTVAGTFYPGQARVLSHEVARLLSHAGAQVHTAPQPPKALIVPHAGSVYPTRLEHSLEVQLPLLQTALNGFQIVPLVVGEATPAEVEEVLNSVTNARGIQTVAVTAGYVQDPGGLLRYTKSGGRRGLRFRNDVHAPGAKLALTSIKKEYRHAISIARWSPPCFCLDQRGLRQDQITPASATSAASGIRRGCGENGRT